MHPTALSMLMPPCSEAPGRIFEVYLVPRCPFSKDGLLGDEAVAAALGVLMDPVHLALTESVLLIVMVRYNTVIVSAVTEGKTLEQLNNKNAHITLSFWFIDKKASHLQ